MAFIFKIPYAERHGKLISIAEVDSGLQADCFCPACKGRLVARKGTKTDRRHHFAHYTETNCQPETVAHQIAKMLLADRIRKAISEHRPLPFYWGCQKCQELHTGDLVKKASRVQAEVSLPECRPDIALLNEQDKIIAIIEIVVTHKPEQNLHDYCTANKVILLEYDILSPTDLDRINATPLRFDRVARCLRPRCPRCHEHLAKRFLVINRGNCWKCKAPMKVAALEIEGMMSPPASLTLPELTLAQRLGARLQKRYSKTLEEAYLANTCTRCRSFIGDHYLHEYWGGPGETSIETGYSCLEGHYVHNLPNLANIDLPAKSQPTPPESTHPELKFDSPPDR